jgi:hypothetical protein
MKIDMNKIYKTRSGLPVRVLCIDADGDYPVIAQINGKEIETYTSAGTWALDFENHFKDLIEVNPYDDFKIDDKVMVSVNGVQWFKRHFAGVSTLPSGNQVALAFDYGATLWSEDGNTSDWIFCRKPTAEELLNNK